MSGSLRATIEMRPTAARLGQTLQDLARRATDMRGAFQKIAADVRGAEAEQFASLGSASGGPWAPLSPAYAAAKARRFPGTGLLVRTGRLVAAMTGRSSDFRMEISQRELIVAIADPVWAIHQHGGRRLPARAVLPDREILRRRWVKIIDQHLRGAAAAVRA